jgi:hypothetical protein
VPLAVLSVAGFVVDPEPALLSVLDLVSDDAAGLDSALPSPFDAPSFAVDSFAFFRSAEG